MNSLSRTTVFVDFQSLQSQGISFTEIHTALEIQCFGKIFFKMAILTQSHKEKAVQICAECQNMGIDAFITESKSFLSIWKEKKNSEPTEQKLDVLDFFAVKPSHEDQELKKQLTVSTLGELGDFLEEDSQLKIIADNCDRKEPNWWHSYLSQSA